MYKLYTKYDGLYVGKYLTHFHSAFGEAIFILVDVTNSEYVRGWAGEAHRPSVIPNLIYDEYIKLGRTYYVFTEDEFSYAFRKTIGTMDTE